MGKQITFRNDLSVQCCQIKFEDGKRILISVAEGEVKIFSLKIFGLLPDKTINTFSVMRLFEFDYYKEILEQLNSEATIRLK